MAKRPYFPRQELAAKGFGPMAIAALERAYLLSDQQVDEIALLIDRLSAQEIGSTARLSADIAGVEQELLHLIGMTQAGPSHADIAQLQAQIDDLKVLTRPPEASPAPAPDLMYPPPYN